METKQGKNTLRFGDFIMATQDAFGERRAKGIIRLAVKTHQVEFEGAQRFEFFRWPGGGKPAQA
jgi:hypothetical protein